MAGLFDQLRKRKPEIEALASKYGIQNIRIYGSVARGDEDENSDIDLLVDLKSGYSAMDLGGFVMDLQEMTGREIHLMHSPSLYNNQKLSAALFRKAIEHEIRPL